MLCQCRGERCSSREGVKGEEEDLTMPSSLCLVGEKSVMGDIVLLCSFEKEYIQLNKNRGRARTTGSRR
jgi:hypothetical protein